jgi:hypothetical protein
VRAASERGSDAGNASALGADVGTGVEEVAIPSAKRGTHASSEALKKERKREREIEKTLERLDGWSGWMDGLKADAGWQSSRGFTRTLTAHAQQVERAVLDLVGWPTARRPADARGASVEKEAVAVCRVRS